MILLWGMSVAGHYRPDQAAFPALNMGAETAPEMPMLPREGVPFCLLRMTTCPGYAINFTHSVGLVPGRVWAQYNTSLIPHRCPQFTR
jgi:hypothetical protein